MLENIKKIKKIKNIFINKFYIFLKTFKISICYTLLLVLLNIILIGSIFSDAIRKLLVYNPYYSHILPHTTKIAIIVYIILLLICNLFIGAATFGSYYRGFNGFEISSKTFLKDSKKYIKTYAFYMIIITIISLLITMFFHSTIFVLIQNKFIYTNSCYIILPLGYLITINKLFYNKRLNNKIYLDSLLIGIILFIIGFFLPILIKILFCFIPYIIFCLFEVKGLNKKENMI